jgi:DNA-binding response OmpR family regulator
MRPRLLVVDDDPDVRDSLRRALGYAGYTVTTAANGLDALSSLSRSPADLVILDVLMPMLDGLDTCRALRDRGNAAPVLVLTARDSIDDRVAGLEVGADDYLVKPFGVRELLARARAALRRVELEARRAQPAGAVEEALVFGPLRVEPASHRATLNGTELALTPKEFELLHLFAANPGRAFNREFLIERVWGGEYEGFDRAVDNHIRRLRQKLGDFGEKIATVWGVGYRFIA